MKVLITGASGQLGAFVIRALRERHDVVLMSRRQPDPEFAALRWVQGDITVVDDCRRAVEVVDAIQHLAAQPWPVDHPGLREHAAAQGIPFDATFQSNMLGTYYLSAGRCGRILGLLVVLGLTLTWHPPLHAAESPSKGGTIVWAVHESMPDLTSTTRAPISPRNQSVRSITAC